MSTARYKVNLTPPVYKGWNNFLPSLKLIAKEQPNPPSIPAPISSQLYNTLGHIKTLAETTHWTLPLHIYLADIFVWDEQDLEALLYVSFRITCVFLTGELIHSRRLMSQWRQKHVVSRDMKVGF